MLALALDIGFGYGQRRLAQNVADSAAVAATKVVAQNAQVPGSQTDAGVRAAMLDAARSASGDYLNYVTAEYVDASLAPLGVTVGSASGNTIPSQAKGVRVSPSKSISTFFGRTLGFTSLLVGTRGTARTDTVIGLHPGMYGPYVIWAGEPQYICRDSSNQPIARANPGNVATADPYGAYKYGCGVVNTTTPQQFSYRCNNYESCAISNNNPRWRYGSNDFKGYLHQSSGYLAADAEADFDVQTGNSVGTAGEPLADLEDCYNRRLLGCTVAMPVIDWADSAGSAGIRLRIIGFVNIRLDNNPATLAPSQPWRGTAVPGSLTYAAGKAVVSGVPPVPGMATVQYVRLVQ
jgi:hypothetical protein